MSALQYDPTKAEHQQFEIKPDPTKSGKSKKKKKKIVEEVEQEPLPEVSTDRWALTFKILALINRLQFIG